MIQFLLAGFLVTSAFAQRSCNNSPLLCGKSYDQITHLGAHDSPFLRDDSTGYSSFGNQYFDSVTQLDAGVRLLSAQVHIAPSRETGARELHLCHTSCGLFDAGSLQDWLGKVGRWMDRNPDEVVTLLLVNPDTVDARELEGEYARANIAHYGYVPQDIRRPPPPSNETHQTWPTLGQMIDEGKRLVTFVNPLQPDKENAPYLLNEFDFVWENAYQITDAANFTCTPDRPANTTTAEMRDSGRLSLMNHFLYWQQAFSIQVPDDRNINNTNSWDGPGGLGTHLLDCSNQVMRQPTFVLVDFFNVGPAIEAIDIFNKVQKATGRRTLTKERPGATVFMGAAGRPVASSRVTVIAMILAFLGWDLV